MSRTSGKSHATRSKPCFDGFAITSGPNCATSLRSISLFVSPARMRAAMNTFMRAAIGELDWSSVVWHVGQTTSPSSSPSVGWLSLAAATGASASTSSKSREQPHSSAFWMPFGERLLRHGARHVRDDPAAAIDEERLRCAADAPAPEQAPVAVAADRIREPELADELARVPREVLVVDADDDEPSAIPASRVLEQRRLVAARSAPGGPEIDDARLAVVTREAQLAVTVQARKREIGSSGRLALAHLRRDVGGAGLVRHLPDRGARAARRRARRRVPAPLGGTTSCTNDKDRSSDIDVVEEPFGVAHVHADAAVRDRVADRRIVVRPVDSDARRRDAHPAGAERVVRPRRHRLLALPPTASWAGTTTGSAT